MISHGKEIKVFTGNANPELAKGICDNLNISLGDAVCTHFADGECSVSVYEPVRGADVFLVQSTCGPVNDNLMELLVMTDAMRRASAGRITAVMPYFGYARQDRKAKSRDPISAKLVANLITQAGADRVLTMDLHAPQIQGFFDIAVDNLAGGPLFANHYKKRFDLKSGDFMVVSPDVGSVARARTFAMKEGKNVLLLDDMVDTAGSLVGAAKAIKHIGGANKIYACASHGVLSGPALERIENSELEELLLFDTIPYPKDQPRVEKIKYLSAAPIFAASIHRIYEDESLASLFE